MIFNVKSINTVDNAGKQVDGMKRPREPPTGGNRMDILDKKLDAVQKSQVVYVTNHTYIDGDEITSRTVSKVDAEMVTNKRKGR